jgi:hypothetical protein
MEHSIDTLTPCEIGVISPHRFLDMLNQHPRISQPCPLLGRPRDGGYAARADRHPWTA